MMGTDIYLKWEGMGKKDEEKQYTGFDITKGSVGYLRASIGMVEENDVLRLIFPERYWGGYGKMYDFKKNLPRLKDIFTAYVEGEKIKVESKSKVEQQLSGDAIRQMIKDVGGEAIEGTLKHDDADEARAWRIKWAKSVVQFFALGLKLQEDGKKPRIVISW